MLLIFAFVCLALRMQKFALSGALVFTFIVFMGQPVQAQLPQLPACAPQIKSLCSISEGKPLTEAREVFGCLRAHDGELETACKSEIERYIQTSRQASARGGGALSSFGGLTGLTPPIPIVTYQGRISPKGPGFSENALTVSSPVYGSAQAITSMSLSAGLLHFKDPVVMTSGQILPPDLYRAEIGFQYSHRLEDKKSFGLRVTAGSTGDQVFQQIGDANFSLSATYGFPGSGTDYWVLLANIANNSTIGDYIPLPGVLYIHRTEHVTGIFGFPVISLQWTPTPEWSYSTSIFGTTVALEAAHGAVDRTQVFAQASFNQQKYILHDRINDRDRLTLQEKKVLVGVRAPIFSSAFGEFQLGHAFDRSLYIGEKIFKSDHGLADLEASGFASATIKYVF